jgi:hypothetical protein
MKPLIVILFVPFMLSTLFAQIPEQIGYQAVLSNADGTPVTDGNYNLTFRIYADSTEGSVLWEENHINVEVENGVVNIQLGSQNPIDLPFDKAYHLSIQIGTDDPLLPRVPLLASPYSLTAKSVQDSSLTSADFAKGQIVRSINNLTDDVTITGGDNVNVNVNGGKLVISATGGGEVDGNSWQLGGNAGTDTSNFVGTLDEQALEFRVNKRVALRLEPTSDGAGNFRPNIIAGGSGNSIADGVFSSTIAGGNFNTVNGEFSFIGGGRNNDASAEQATIAGGFANVADRYSTVGGGQINKAQGFSTTVSGGTQNEANGDYATVSGGQGNIASGDYTFIGGGRDNRAEGGLSMVPGGFQAFANGFVSFAAGYNARALHDGAFVWADAGGIPNVFSSTGEDQFLIRAAGGVGIGTNAPTSPLTVAGQIESTTGGYKFPDGTIQTSAAGNGHSLDAADGNPTDALFVDNEGRVGINTTQPDARLHVVNTGTGHGMKLYSDLTGFIVEHAGVDGLFITEAGRHGVQVIKAGNPSAFNNNTESNAFMVQGAEGFGLFVGHADLDGVHVQSAGNDGVDAKSNSAVNFGGRFVNGASGGSGIYALGGSGDANDLILGANDGSSTGDDGRIASDPNQSSSDLFLTSNDAVIVELDKDSNGEDADFEVRNSDGKVLLDVDDSGNASLLGTLTEQSDRNAKAGITPVDVQTVLNKVGNLPISTWTYKNNPGVKHIGPMAQDFKATFEVGENETSISTIDRDGVALAAIQALNQLLIEKDNKIAELEARLAKIETAMGH